MTTSTFNVRLVNLTALDSMTKYPSIPTYHELDNGTLTETVMPFDGWVVLTEKVDGTNGRIIVMPDGSYVIGSRKELLHASGDLVANPALGIADTLRPLADELASIAFDEPAVRVFYLEVYGGKVTAASKNYSTRGAVGARLFDIARIVHFDTLLTWETERIASWRDNGGQEFLPEPALVEVAKALDVELTPRLGTVPARDLPETLAGTAEWLKRQLPQTRVALDDSAQGRPEGIVLRTEDRSVIAKARVQDYAKALRHR